MIDGQRLRDRLLWFVGLWVAGVVIVSAVGYGIRLWLSPV